MRPAATPANQPGRDKGKDMSKLTTYLRAAYAGLYAVTHEEARATETIVRDCKLIGFKVYQWSVTQGLITPEGKALEMPSPDGKKTMRVTDPMAALRCYQAVTPVTGEPNVYRGAHIPNKSVLIMQDLHVFLQQKQPLLLREIKDAVRTGRGTSRCLVMMGCQLALPPELEKEFTVIDFPLPSKEELLPIVHELSGGRQIQLSEEEEQRVLEAGVGLTYSEFEDAVAASIIEVETVCPLIVGRIKAETIKKGGLLEIIKPGVTFDNIGGLAVLKDWIVKRKRAFTKEARAFGCPTPKGVCLFGVQGAGKSLVSQAIAAELGVPLLALNVGKLFAGLVGGSESNVRAVINQIEAFGACCVRIDEIDKGFAGMVGGSSGDSGTTRRVIGHILTWMAEKTSPVFIVATANDLTQLPPELLRKGRWDELFFLDLPTKAERVEIWNVHIGKKGRKAIDFDLDQLAEVTDGWTGAEIESLMGEAMHAAFYAGTEPDTELLVGLSEQTMPLSKTMAESMDRLREWARGRARSASTVEGEATRMEPVRQLS